MPLGSPEATAAQPRLQTLNLALTERCNLRCVHCAGLLGRRALDGGEDELTTDECGRLLREAAALGCRLVVLSGGEPLLRDDLLDVARRAHEAGLRWVVLSNGMLIDDGVAHRLAACPGLEYVRLSLDAADDAGMYRVRGVRRGAERVLAAVERLVSAGVTVGVGMTLMPGNLDQVEAVARAATERGARFLRAVPVVATGRAAAQDVGTEFFARCALAMLRLRRRSGAAPASAEGPEARLSRRLARLLPRCGGGAELASVSAFGRVSICPLVDEEPGRRTVRDTSLRELLAGARAAKERRLASVDGPRSSCRGCAHRAACGGGCVAEATIRSRGDDHVQPLCMDRIWTATLRRAGTDGAVRGAVEDLLREAELLRDLRRSPACVRSLPLWTTPLSRSA